MKNFLKNENDQSFFNIIMIMGKKLFLAIIYNIWKKKFSLSLSQDMKNKSVKIYDYFEWFDDQL